ncbi:MAG: glutamine-hydrolyzing carbamoyl-phosphate synthase small subunit [Planctomycetes bacterium]|nr:glutamine-hydrolyzing carbamoyl-phosphate synthase small subunit [Planctomycetota bacterium]
MKAKLALEDGRVFEGESFGASGERSGEVVFNTSMTGYQEILTDPSYKGQIVTMTYPLIGNYGANSEDIESVGPQVEGFVVRELSRIRSNFRSDFSLEDFLRKHGIIGIEGVDTRSLTLHIRVRGAMMGVISTADMDDASLVQKAKTAPNLVGRDLVKDVTCSKPHEWKQGLTSEFALKERPYEGKRHKVVAMDYGVKRNILRMLVQSGCDVTVLPASATADEIMAHKPDGVFLSNGPGDPEPVSYAIENVRKLIGRVPIFGICLGHEFLGLAFGGKVFKLKFGHRGANQPVMDLSTQKVEITSQNHGFAVDLNSLNQDETELTHVNLNDRTLEGLRHRKLPIFSIQYHPEASPGPHDASYLFPRFKKMMAEGRPV